MKYLKLICIFFLFVFSGFLFSYDLNQAEQYYKNGKYDEALSIYRDALKEYPTSKEILYNIGNIYFKKDKIGFAISYYLAAKKYAPQDSDIKQNLKIAQANMVDKNINENQKLRHYFYTLIDLVTFNFVFVLFLTFFTLFVILNALWIFKYRSEWFKNVYVVSIIVVIVSIVSLFIKYEREFSVIKGVVVVRKSPVRSGPSDSFSTVFFVHEGLDFEVQNKANQWVKIKLHNGFIGWINRSDYTEVK